jgi:chromosome segregation ATPase
MDQVNNNIDEFDEEIKEMQKEKYRLESDLKSAELKWILLYEELILLDSMQPEDLRLSNELKKCTESKGFIIKEIQEISKKLISKRAEVEDIKEEELKLLA